MAAKASRKASVNVRLPPPPIAESTAPIDIYESIDARDSSPPPPRHQQQQQQSNHRRIVPPVPLADDTDYIQPNEEDDEEEEGDEYEDQIEYRDDRRDYRGGGGGGHEDRHYEEAHERRQTQEAYYADTAQPNRHSYQSHSPLNYRPGTSPPGNYTPELYEHPPFENEPYDHRNYQDHNDYLERRDPVDRRQSQKKMGRAIVTGLNTARVKEIKQRLRPAFGPDELIDSIERKTQSSSSVDDDLAEVDVSRLTVAQRMKLIEAKAAAASKGTSQAPPTYPKPRPKGAPAVAALSPTGHLGRRVDVLPSRAEPRLIVATSSPSGSPTRSASRPNSQILDDAPWFFGNSEQHKCEEKLLNLGKEGAFVIRVSKKGETRMQPYTLCVLHENNIYNLMVRQKSNQRFAVGSEKPGEPEFSSLAELVKFHADIPIEVISKTKSGRSSGADRVWLTMSPLK